LLGLVAQINALELEQAVTAEQKVLQEARDSLERRRRDLVNHQSTNPESASTTAGQSEQFTGGMMGNSTADIAAESSPLSFTLDEVKQLQQFVQGYLVSAGGTLPLSLQDTANNISLADHVVQLTELATEKRLANREEMELSAIRSNVQFNDFYFIMYQVLDNAVTGCQALASGLVAHGSDGSFRSWLGSLLKEGAWVALKALPPFQKIVTWAVKWASQQLPLPFGDFVVTLIQVLSSVKEERDSTWRWPTWRPLEWRPSTVRAAST
jgi:hypothetical protein